MMFLESYSQFWFVIKNSKSLAAMVVWKVLENNVIKDACF